MKTAVAFVLLALCAAAVAAEEGKRCPDGKRCFEPPEPDWMKPDKCDLPYCLASNPLEHGFNFGRTCFPLVVDRFKRVGKVCFMLLDNKKLEVIIDVTERCRGVKREDEAAQAAPQPDQAATPQAEPTPPDNELSCYKPDPCEDMCDHWKMLDIKFWISPDFDSVPTTPAGLPLPSKFPFPKFGQEDHNWPWHVDGRRVRYEVPLWQILGPGYDIHHICYDVLWFAVHVHLACMQENDEGDEFECEDAWAKGESFQEIHDGEPMYNHLQILCHEECREMKRDPTARCLTAYARATRMHDCPVAWPFCFHELPTFPDLDMWGWTNMLYEEGHYTMELYAGGHDCPCPPRKGVAAAKDYTKCRCDTGELVGNVYVDFSYDKFHDDVPGHKREDAAAAAPAPAAADEEAIESSYNKEDLMDGVRKGTFKLGRLLIRFVTKPGWYLDETEFFASTKSPLPIVKWGKTMRMASFPHFYNQPFPPFTPEHEQLQTRIDEYVVYVAIPKSARPSRCDADIESLLQKRDDAEASPAPAGEPESPLEMSYEKVPTKCGPFLFVVAHAMVCEGDVVGIPDPHEHPHMDMIPTIEDAPAVEAATPAQKKK